MTEETQSQPAAADEPEQGGISMLWMVIPLILVGILGGIVGAMLSGGDGYPDDNSADAGFLRDMSVHHAQAVRMASYTYLHTEDEAIRTLAYDILTTQQAQIGIMSGWLDMWGLPTAQTDAPMAWMGHEVVGPMPGMATSEELANLETLTGPELDIEFLRLMITHHEGGAPMAVAAVDLVSNTSVKNLASSIAETQNAETTYMNQLYAERAG